MAKSTTSKILDVWSMVSGLDRKGKQIIRDKLNAEVTDTAGANVGIGDGRLLLEMKSTIREPEMTIKKEGV